MFTPTMLSRRRLLRAGSDGPAAAGQKRVAVHCSLIVRKVRLPTTTTTNNNNGNNDNDR